MSKPLQPRNLPSQKRSIARQEQILEVAGELLEKLGPAALTTIRIAEEVGISVGTLYHYFPNKEAILHAMGQRWLQQMANTLTQDEHYSPATLQEFVELFVNHMHQLYRKQRGLLHLVQGMFAIPQLMTLDEQHDELVINHVASRLEKLGVPLPLSERQRIGRTFHETSHALLLVVVNQSKPRGSKTLEELKRMLHTLAQSLP
ncbi:TetR/AcrR family transcriptional regulator [Bowmanella denitrificans]|uniref:TetR/AcrR family transcriptional regulator n=1 Tax=Bowmanella denitrificans TaxID=366582 RepID=A0ABN0X5C1_9ALTE